MSVRSCPKSLLAVCLLLSAAAAAATPAVQAQALEGSLRLKSPPQKQQGPWAEEAWVAEAPPAAKHAALYLTLRGGGRDDVLVGVTSPLAAAAEVHEVSREQGLTRMRPAPALAVPARAGLRFAPGGRHIMLINLKRLPSPGERVPLTLRFRYAGPLAVEAVVRPLQPEAREGTSHHHHDHH